MYNSDPDVTRGTAHQLNTNRRTSCDATPARLLVSEGSGPVRRVLDVAMRKRAGSEGSAIRRLRDLSSTSDSQHNRVSERVATETGNKPSKNADVTDNGEVFAIVDEQTSFGPDGDLSFTSRTSDDGYHRNAFSSSSANEGQDTSAESLVTVGRGSADSERDEDLEQWLAANNLHNSSSSFNDDAGSTESGKPNQHSGGEEGGSGRNLARLPSLVENQQLTGTFRVVEPQPGEEPLPRGWEARVGSHGRVFYIDHVNRQTTWTRPVRREPVSRMSSSRDEDRRQMDRRYASIRRTMSMVQRDDPATFTIEQASQSSTSSGPVQSDERPSEARNWQGLPAIKFLRRPDLFTFIQTSANALADLKRNSTLKHMINKIRRDPQVFERYQHNRDLVSFLNLFAERSLELPRSWEMKFDLAHKPFFIDNSTRTTTFIDPRLPLEPARHGGVLGLASRTTNPSEEDPSAPLTSRARQPVDDMPQSYNEKVVAFLRQPNVDEILKQKHTNYASSCKLRRKVDAIRNDGDAMDRYSNDVELITLLSMYDNDIMSYVPSHLRQTSQASPRDSPQGSPHGSPGMQRHNVRIPAPYKRDFQAKLRNFHRKLESKGYGQGPSKIKLTVRREHVLEDAFTKVMQLSKTELQKSKLFIAFAGEEMHDYGGPSLEFFFLLSRELFNPYYGLFEYSATDTYTVQISPVSNFVENTQDWFRFVGRVIGLCVMHQYLLDAFFTRPFYKSLLRILPSIADLESLDAVVHQSLMWTKDNDMTDCGLDLVFSVNEEVLGQVSERDLKPNGKNVAVTEKNKAEYIERMVRWRVERGVAEQTASVVRGFYEVIDPRIISIFDARELELVIAGTLI